MVYHQSMNNVTETQSTLVTCFAGTQSVLRIEACDATHLVCRGRSASVFHGQGLTSFDNGHTNGLTGATGERAALAWLARVVA
jgi:hypothetical protein